MTCVAATWLGDLACHPSGGGSRIPFAAGSGTCLLDARGLQDLGPAQPSGTRSSTGALSKIGQASKPWNRRDGNPLYSGNANLEFLGFRWTGLVSFPESEISGPTLPTGESHDD